MKGQWWKKAVVYQIYPQSFCDSDGDGIGDLKGIIKKLDYIKYLGVDVIWLSPVYRSPKADNGYDISDYYSISREFGSMDEFDLLVKEVHARGIRIIMDLVVNHTSDEHPWFIESRKSVSNPYREYYIWRAGKENQPPNNWGSWFNGSAWEYDSATDMYYLHIFSKKQPDLNWENATVRKEIYQMMDWWLSKGIDGFRMDVISLISKKQDFPDGRITGTYGSYGDLTPLCENGPKVHKYLKEMNREVLSKYDIMTVGETPNASVQDAAEYTNSEGTELNMVFQFEHVMVDYGKYGKYTKNRYRVSDLIRVLSKWQEGLYENGWNSLYLENHDQPRSVSRFGDTSNELFWNKSAKMLATCLFMLQGTPYIYQGQEIGMTNPMFDSLEDYPDIEAKQTYDLLVKQEKVMSAADFLSCVQNLGRDNARTPMQWNTENNAGFTKGTPWIKVNENYDRINVKRQIDDEDSILNYYRKLIELRKIHDIISDGKYELLELNSENLWGYQRRNEYEQIEVYANFSSFVVVCEYIKNENKKVLISNYKDIRPGLLRPYEAIVYYEKVIKSTN